MNSISSPASKLAALISSAKRNTIDGPVIDPKADAYREHPIEWPGLPINIRYLTGSFAGMDHIEVISKDRVELPITKTGYRSLFLPPKRIAEHGTAVGYVLAWLKHEADTKEWKRKQEE